MAANASPCFSECSVLLCGDNLIFVRDIMENFLYGTISLLISVGISAYYTTDGGMTLSAVPNAVLAMLFYYKCVFG